MPNNYKLYDLTVSVITPLHIGNGITLLKDYDYAVHDKKTWRINESALLEAQDIDDPEIRQKLIENPRPPAEFLIATDYKNKPEYFRYVLNGEPRSTKEGAPVQEQIKDVYDQPYLPGSSLKGALRTAIAWVVWEEEGLVPDIDMLKNEKGKLPVPKKAAQNYEKQIFREKVLDSMSDIEADFMRALQVSDGKLITQTGNKNLADYLELINIYVKKRGDDIDNAIPIEAEAIKAGTKFSITLKIDTALFSKNWAKEKRLAEKGERWLNNLPEILQKYMASYWEYESNWHEGEYIEKVDKYYREKAKGDRFLLQLGAGTGWRNKTFGSRLLANSDYNEEFVYTVLEDLKVTKEAPADLEAFPTTRSVKDKPLEPLGWVLVEMEERE